MFATRDNLRAAGIEVAGMGANVAEARAPVVIERNGVRFAFLAYDDVAPYYQATETTAGSAPLDETTIAADIASAEAVADVVIVLPQWGIEYQSAPSERQRQVAAVAANAGAALIAGNHPHVVQGHEQVGDTFVAYALGNFLFDQDWSLETQQGVLLEVMFTGARLTGWRYIPVRIHDRYQPRLAEGDEAASILQRIEAASP
jgi:poly-gamma-glutamate synthesis protein (capsule biosynthesis protein)